MAYGPIFFIKGLRRLDRVDNSIGEVRRVELTPRSSALGAQELVMKVPWTSGRARGMATALIDTGCRVGLLARPGLLET